MAAVAVGLALLRFIGGITRRRTWRRLPWIVKNLWLILHCRFWRRVERAGARRSKVFVVVGHWFGFWHFCFRLVPLCMRWGNGGAREGGRFAFSTGLFRRSLAATRLGADPLTAVMLVMVTFVGFAVDLPVQRTATLGARRKLHALLRILAVCGRDAWCRVSRMVCWLLFICVGTGLS